MRFTVTFPSRSQKVVDGGHTPSSVCCRCCNSTDQLIGLEKRQHADTFKENARYGMQLWNDVAADVATECEVMTDADVIAVNERLCNEFNLNNSDPAAGDEYSMDKSYPCEDVLPSPVTCAYSTAMECWPELPQHAGMHPSLTHSATAGIARMSYADA